MFFLDMSAQSIGTEFLSRFWLVKDTENTRVPLARARKFGHFLETGVPRIAAEYARCCSVLHPECSNTGIQVRHQVCRTIKDIDT